MKTIHKTYMGQRVKIQGIQDKYFIHHISKILFIISTKYFYFKCINLTVFLWYNPTNNMHFQLWEYQVIKFLLISLDILISAASNHMNSTTLPLNNVQKYKGRLHIKNADGNSLPIIVVGNISTSLNNVFVFPKLSTNLKYVGQQFNFQNLVALCGINCPGRWSQRGLKWDVSFMYSHHFLQCWIMFHVMSLNVINKCSING